MGWRDFDLKTEAGQAAYQAHMAERIRACALAVREYQPADIEQPIGSMRDFVRLLERLHYGDALYFADGSRLEFIAPDAGLPCFWYYRTDLRLIGIVQVPSFAYLEGIRMQLYRHLKRMQVPLTKARLVECGALTVPDARPHYRRKLFRYTPPKPLLRAQAVS